MSKTPWRARAPARIDNETRFNWDYRELRERIADGYTLRQFTEFYCQPVPKHDAFNPWLQSSG